jgi:hypothetical protein
MKNSTGTFNKNVTAVPKKYSLLTATGLAEGGTVEVAITPVHFSSEILIYITTVFSDGHQRFLRFCWPQLLNESRLFPNAHFMIFSNNVTALDEQFLAEIKDLFLAYHVKSFEFKFADGTPELDQYMDYNRQEEMLGGWKRLGTAMQYGANMAMSIGFSAGWFQPFDWIVRINPDVLIRQSDFLVDHVDDPSIDAIVLWCRPEQIHTDFVAFRPQTLAPDAFAHMQEVPLARIGYDGMPNLNAEVTATNEFKAIMESGRYITVPDVTPSKGFCRIRGPMAPVVHKHGCKS